ncbi:hypothetical protein TSOC_010802 [Tetrabaena socialis]|uniref:Uncharacterized protein n=1 Tax=Tetrabaena socialis TaxID=47790 RepID=A0A2J7ZSC6_9CHLO|nr:hypothetical protein TSOC_010802 [Tetrabaena socialis]|eukprot:PNH03171.1 hypothetical protein TSOC_010802 [Tetrabaena socialis]
MLSTLYLRGSPTPCAPCGLCPLFLRPVSVRPCDSRWRAHRKTSSAVGSSACCGLSVKVVGAPAASAAAVASAVMSTR